MTYNFWPDTLPSQLLADGFTEKPQSNVIRTTMDAGPKKARRRYTARTVIYSGKQRLTRDEMEIFKQFYQIVLADGVLRFFFSDPITQEIAEFRFTEDYTAVEIDGLYEVQMSLERL